MTVDLIQTLNPNQGYDSQQTWSPEQIKMLREWAGKLYGDRYKGYPYTWANGLSDAANKVVGALFMRDAANQERRGINTFTDRRSDYELGRNPNTQPPPNPYAGNPPPGRGGISNADSPFPLAQGGKSGDQPQPGSFPPTKDGGNSTGNQDTPKAAPPTLDQISGKTPTSLPTQTTPHQANGVPRSLVDDTASLIQTYRDHLNKRSDPLTKVASADPNFVPDTRELERNPLNPAQEQDRMTRPPAAGNAVPHEDKKNDDKSKGGGATTTNAKGPDTKFDVAMGRVPKDVPQPPPLTNQPPPVPDRTVTRPTDLTPPNPTGSPNSAPPDIQMPGWLQGAALKNATPPSTPPLVNKGATETPPPPAPPPRAVTPPPSQIPPPNGQQPPPYYTSSPYGNQPLPVSQLNRETADYIRGVGHDAQMILSEQQIKDARNNRLANMLQYSVDPMTGRIRVDEPGRPPMLMPPQPGQTQFNPQLIERPGMPFPFRPVFNEQGQIVSMQPVPIVPPNTQIAPHSVPNANQPPVSGPPSTQTQPIPQTVPNVGPLSQPPPQVTGQNQPPPSQTLPPQVTPNQPPHMETDPKKVTEDLIKATTKGSNVKGVTLDESKRLPTSNPPDREWQPIFDDAAKKAPPDYSKNINAPDIYDTDINRMAQWGKRSDAYGQALAESMKEDAKRYADLDKNIEALGDQARKQQPSLKAAVSLLEHMGDNGLEMGPGAVALTDIRAWKQEVGRLANKWKGEGFDVPFADYLSKWSKEEGGEANQVFNKYTAALTLENMRNMLGQNAGQFRVYELQLMREAMGSEKLSPVAQRTLLEIMDRINDRAVLHEQMASYWHDHYGNLDQRFRNALVNFDINNPTFTEDEANKYINEFRKGNNITSGKPSPNQTTQTAPQLSPETQQRIDEIRRRLKLNGGQ